MCQELVTLSLQMVVLWIQNFEHSKIMLLRIQVRDSQGQQRQNGLKLACYRQSSTVISVVIPYYCKGELGMIVGFLNLLPCS